MAIDIFTANDGTNGVELWESDGTAAGTVLLKDINAGAGSSNPTGLFYSGSDVYFTAFDGINTLLWRTDGTTGGTVAVTSATNGGAASNLIPVGGTIFFTGSDSVHGSGLFAIDGQTGAVSFVKAVAAPSQFTAVGSRLFFQSYDGADGYELWSSDGTPGGTGIVKDIYPGNGSSSPANLVNAGGRLFFTANDGTNGTELFASDGTAAGTVLVRDINAGSGPSSPSSLTALGTSVLFLANDGVHGSQLWISDGTTAGTKRLTDNGASYVTAFNGKAYFNGNDGLSGAGHGSGLYSASANGTVAFVTGAPQIAGYYTSPLPFGTTLVYVGTDAKTYSFDGTTATTIAAYPITNGVVSGSQIFFTHDDGTNGAELWVSDGTAAGTHITKDINPGGYGSNPGNITAVSGGVTFTATDDTGDTEVYFSDGTAAHTGLIKDVNPTANLSPSFNIATTPVTAGTESFFSGNDNVHGNELWASDGTLAGTHQVKDLLAGASGSNPNSFTAVGSTIFFTANDGVTGTQLYTSTGAVGNEMRLTNNVNSSPGYLTAFGTKLYFNYDDGLTGAGHGSGLYSASANGTVAFVTGAPQIAGYYTSPLPFGTTLVYVGTDAKTYSFDGTTATTIAAYPITNGVVSGSQIFFTHDDGTNGAELWVSDGTAAGTHITKDVNPGGYGSNPGNITAVSGGVTFTATDDTGDTEVYFSDGTAAHTGLIKDVNATQNPNASFNIGTTPVTAGTESFFSGNDNVHGNELWASDGTLAGTHQVKDLLVGASGSNPNSFTAVGSTIFFTANDGVTGTQLYTSTGAVGSETRLTTNVNSSPGYLTAFGTKLYFNYDDGLTGAGHGSGLYSASANGTVAFVTGAPQIAGYYTSPLPFGTTLVYVGTDAKTYSFDGTTATTIAAYPITNGVVSGSQIFFTHDDGTNGAELWVSDGTAAGTHITKDVNPGGYGSNPGNITAVSGGVTFTATNDTGDTEVYFSDGTAAHTGLIKDVNATQNPNASFNIGTTPVTAGTESFFSGNDNVHGNELWASDGTLAGTHQVKDLLVGASGSNPNSFTAVGSTIFFTANDGVTGTQLYTSTGAVGNEMRLTNNVNSSPGYLTAFGTKLYFNYDDGLTGAGHGSGLYSASANGTVAFVTGAPQIAGYYTSPLPFGTTLVYVGTDAKTYSFDGTTATTIAAYPITNGVVSGSQIFFTHDDGTNGAELWVSDGTAAGTHITKDVNPGSGASNPTGIVAFGSGVAFLADDGTDGQELWVSNGTSAGTKLVKDIYAGATGSNIQNLTVLGSQSFFSANDGADGQELWVSDGTAGGTHIVKDIVPGTGSTSPSNFLTLAGKFYFLANDGTNGTQLWTSDGTAAGTAAISPALTIYSNIEVLGGKLFFAGADNSGYVLESYDGTTFSKTALPGYVSDIRSIGGKVSFQTYDSTNGYELYTSDGTAAGTVRITDTGTPNSSGATNFVTVGGKGFFLADDGTHGQELFVTDGTTAGTHLVKDINPGTPGSAISALTVLSGKLYFLANDGTNGAQLWTSDGTAGGTTAVSPANLAIYSNVEVVGGKLFFAGADNSGYVLESYDGTTFSKTALPGYVSDIRSIGGKVSFQTYDSTNGYELYTSDGTAAGTVRITDIGTPNSSGATNFVTVGGKGFFLADDGMHGQELFVTDGTTAGTHLVKDINPGTPGSAISALTALNGKLYFLANDGTNGAQLWTSDGTAGGTTAVSPANLAIYSNVEVVGGKLFFAGADNSGYVLESYDGTTFNKTALPGYVSDIRSIGGKVSFQTYDSTNGYELYTSDGTAAGTVRITDTKVPNSSNASNFVDLANVAPTLTGAVAGQATGDKTAVSPFGGVTVADADRPDQTESVTVTLDDAAKGSFTAASLTATGFAAGGSAGTYVYAGTADAVTAALHGLVFAPTENRVAVGQTETTTFTVNVDDGAGGSVTNRTTTVVATSINDAPAPGTDSVAVAEDVSAVAATRAAGMLGNDTDPDVGTGASFSTANLLVDAGAESGSAATDETGTVAPQGWTGTGTARTYASTGVVVQPGEGAQLFAGGPSGAATTDMQTVDVSAYAAQIDGGTTSVKLSGLFGGYQSRDDHADLKAVFLDAAGTVLGTSATVGDVLAADRGNVTELLARSGQSLIPVGTRSIRAVLTFTGTAGAYNNGYADNLSVSLAAPPALEATTLVVSGAHAGGGSGAVDTPVAAGSQATAIVGTYGTLSIKADGTYGFTPNAAAAEALPQGVPATQVFSYTARDIHGASTPSTLTFNITGVNDAPIAVADTASATEAGGTANGTAGAPAIGNVLANDTDVDQPDTKAVSGVAAGTTAAALTSGTGTAVAGAHGTLTLNADGSFSYVVDDADIAVQALRQATDTLSDAFTYTMQDSVGATSTTTLTVAIHGADDAPVSVADTASATEAGGTANGTAGAPATGNVLANDTDVDAGDTKTVAGVAAGTTAAALTAGAGTAVAGAHGTLTLNADGSFSYVVDDADTAVQALRLATDTLGDTFSYTAKDAAGLTSTTTLTVTVHGADDAPVSVADTASATEAGGTANGTAGAPATGNVLSNDTDVDAGDTKTVAGVAAGTTAAALTAGAGTAVAGAHGTLTLNADGSFSYVVSDADTAVQALRLSTDTLADSFSYTTKDAAGLTSTTTLTVAIHGADDAPVAVADAASATEAGGTANGTAGAPATGNVLANDTDVDAGDTKTVAGVAAGTTATALTAGAGTAVAGAHGTLTLNADGSFSYVVDDADTAVQALRLSTDTLGDTFSYTAKDAAGLTSTTTLTVTVHGADDAPVSVADTASATEAGGTANGTAGAPATGNVLANDTDVDAGDTKTVAGVAAGTTAAALTAGAGTAVAGAHGTLTLNADGSFSYVVSDADTAVQALRLSTDTLADSFSYTAKDAAGLTSTTTLTVAIHGADDAPVAVADAASATEAGGTANGTAGAPATGNVLANDTDVDAGDTKTVAGVAAGTTATALTAGAGTAVAGAHGTLTLNADGSFSYVVDDADTAVQALRLSTDTLADSFSYTARDAAGLTSTTTLTVAIHGADDAPVSVADAASATEAGGTANGTAGAPATGNVLANDTDVDAGDTKTVAGVAAGTTAAALTAGAGTAVAGAHGTLTLNADGSFSYAVDDADTAVQALRLSTDTLADSFSYTARDAAGLTSTTTLTVAIHGADDAPVAVADTASATEAGGTANGTAGAPATGNVLANDTDVDAGDTKTVAGVAAGTTAAALTAGAGTAVAGAHGTLTLNADGSFSYAVDDADTAVQALRLSTDTLADSFSYTARDAAGLTSTTTLTVAIHGADDAPVAVADATSATEAGGTANGTAGAPATGNVLANDTDVDAGDTKTVAGVAAGTTAATLTAGAGTAVAGAHGTLTLNADGSFSYAVDDADTAVQALRQATDTLADSFSYTARDAAGLTSTTTLTVAIHGADDAPVSVADAASATEAGGTANGTAGAPATGNVLANDTDVDAGDTKTVAGVAAGTTATALTAGAGTAVAGAHGTLTLNADGSFSYVVSDADTAVQALRLSTDTLADSFSYTARDAAGLTSTTTLTVAIHGADDAPVAVDDSASAVIQKTDGTGGVDPTGNVLANDTDVDAGDTKTVSMAAAGSAPGTPVTSAGSVFVGDYGTLTLKADGSYGYAVDNGNAAVQSLRTSPGTLSDTFAYTVRDAAGLTATATLSIAIGSLSVTTSGPGIDASGNGVVGTGRTVAFTLASNDVLTVTGSPILSLNDGGTARYLSGSGSSSLTFAYLVGPQQNTADVTITATNLNGGTITTAGGQPFDLASAIGNPSGLLRVDTVSPAVTFAAVSYADTGVQGDGVTTDATVTFSGTVSDDVAVRQVEVFSGATDLGTATLDGTGGWSLSAVLPQGRNAQFQAVASDTAGNTASAANAAAVTVDQTPPALAFGTVAFTDTGVQGDHLTSNRAVTLSGTVSDNVAVHGVEVFDGTTDLGQATLDGAGGWSLSTSLADGPHTGFNATATDTAGNTATASNATGVTVDTVAPTVTFQTVAFSDTGVAGDGVTRDGAVTFTGRVSDNTAVGGVEVFNGSQDLGAATLDGTGGWSLSTTLPQGSYAQLSALANDTAGNTASAASPRGLTVDTTAPMLAFGTVAFTDTGVPGDHVTANPAVTLSGTVSDNVAVGSIEVFDGATDLGQATLDGTGGWSLSTSLAAGPHTGFTATASDTAGNAASASNATSLTVDTAKPAVTFATVGFSDTGVPGDNLTDNPAVTLSGRVSDNVAVGSLHVFDGTTDLGAATLDGTGGWSLSARLGDGSHSGFTATAADTAGNTASASNNTAVTVDTVSPAVTFAAVSYADTGVQGDGVTTDAAVTFSGTVSDDVAVKQVEVFSGATDLGTATLDGTGGWSLSAVLPQGRNAQFQAVAGDTAGNTASAANAAAVTVDRTPPALAFGTVAFTDTGVQGDHLTSNRAVTLSGTVSDNVAAHGVEVFDGTTDLGQATLDGAGGWSLSTSLADGPHTGFNATATDTAGNTASASNATGVTVDTVAPTVSFQTVAFSDTGVAGDGVTRDGAVTFTGRVSDNTAVGGLEVFNGSRDLGAATLDGTGGWSLSTTLPQGSYAQLSALAVDTAGNTASAAGPRGLTVDTTAPHAPTVTLADETGSSQTDAVTSDPSLAVMTAENGGTLLYSIDGGTYATAAPVFATDGTADGRHTVSVEQQDAAGNISAPGSRSFTLDTRPPTISSVTLDKAAYKLGDTVTASIKLAGASDGNGAYTLGSSGTIDGAALTGGVYDAGTNTLKASFVVGAGTQEVIAGNVAINVVVDDAAGNASPIATTPISNETIDTRAPTAVSVAGFTNGTTDTGKSAIAAGSRVGALSTADASQGDSFTYTLGGTDAGRFTIANGALQVGGTALTDGTPYAIAVTSRDLGGNSYTQQVLVTGATVPTVTSINRAGPTALTNAASNPFTVTFSQAVNGVQASSFTLSGTDRTGTIGAPTTADGGTTWTVPVTGLSGNGTLGLDLTSTTNIVSTSTGTALGGTHASDQDYTVDTTAPTVVITSPGGGITTSAQQTISGTVAGSVQGSSVSLYANGSATRFGTAAVQSNGTWSTTVTLAQGANSIVAQDTDLAGNTGSSSPVVETLGSVPSVTEMLAQDTGLSVTDGITRLDTVTGRADPNATVSVSIDGTTAGTTADGSGVYNYTPAGLADGRHTIVASEASPFGTGSSAPVTFTLDTTAPVVSSPTLTVMQNAAATPIGIAAPSDNLTAAGNLAIVAGALPTDGTVTLADGTTAVTGGMTLTAIQLQSLLFTPSPGASSQGSTFSYSVTDEAGNAGTGVVALNVGAPGTPTDMGTNASPRLTGAPSFNPSVSYHDGVFTLTGTIRSSTATGVEISATVDGTVTDLGSATVNADGTFDFADLIGAHSQSFITATETDGPGGMATSADPGFSLQGGLNRKGFKASQTVYTDDGSAETSTSLFRSDGSRKVDVMTPYQTFTSAFFDTFDNHEHPNSTFVFNPGHGLDIVNQFRVDGTDHDTLNFLGSDFGNSIAKVLRNTTDTKAGAVILDPTSGDTVRLTGITKAQLKANPGDFTFHA